MNALKRRMTPIGNRVGVWMYRAFRGRLSSGSKAVHVLMITTPGGTSSERASTRGWLLIERYPRVRQPGAIGSGVI